MKTRIVIVIVLLFVPVVLMATVPEVNNKTIPLPPLGFTEDITKSTTLEEMAEKPNKEITIVSLAREVQSLQNQNKKLSEEIVRLDKRIDSLVKINEIRDKQIDMLTDAIIEMDKQVPDSTKSIKVETPSAIESQIDGEFNGWDGETIFKLTNGQIWQQSSYDYTYHYAYRPKVAIYKVNGKYKMKVEDVKNTIEVKRIK
jgi:hypothetical protein